MTDLGVKEMASLTALTKLDLSYCGAITDEGVACLGVLRALRDLDLGECL